MTKFERTLKYHKSPTATVPVTFKYSGGPYIDVHYGSHKQVCLSVVNVWDYAAGESRVNDRGDFNRAVVEFWHDNMDEIRDCIRQLPHYLRG